MYILLYHSVRLTVKTSNKVVDERLATYEQRCHQCVRSSTLRRKSTVTWHASDHETPCRELCFSLLGIAAHRLIHRLSFYLFYDLQVLLRLAIYLCNSEIKRPSVPSYKVFSISSTFSIALRFTTAKLWSGDSIKRPDFILTVVNACFHDPFVEIRATHALIRYESNRVLKETFHFVFLRRCE